MLIMFDIVHHIYQNLYFQWNLFMITADNCIDLFW